VRAAGATVTVRKMMLFQNNLHDSHLSTDAQRSPVDTQDYSLRLPRLSLESPREVPVTLAAEWAWLISANE